VLCIIYKSETRVPILLFNHTFNSVKQWQNKMLVNTFKYCGIVLFADKQDPIDDFQQALYMCIYMCIYIYIYTHTHTHTQNIIWHTNNVFAGEISVAKAFDYVTIMFYCPN
jgi:hypothetical protein